MAEHQLPLRLRLPPDTRASPHTPPQVFLQNKARREDFCPRKLRQMHLMIDQLMAHSHLRYKGEGPLATPKLAHGHLAPGPVPRPLPQTGEGGQTWSPDLNLTTQHRRPSPPPALRHGACSLSRVLSTRHSVHVAVQRLPWAPA